VIRQAISCDICGRDKQQTNHWFVAYEHGQELRISGWNSQARMSLKSKHLCGQTCLHKLVDDFMARTIAVRVAALQEEVGLTEPKPVLAAADSSLTSAPAHFIPLRALSPPNTYDDDLESSARVVTARGEDGPVEAPLPPDRPAYNSRAWRAEAWKREQEREKRSARSLPTPRRRSIA
jgi:hypothetical protein